MIYKLNVESISINNKRKFVFHFYNYDNYMSSKSFDFTTIENLKNDYKKYIEVNHLEVKNNATITFNSDKIFFDIAHLPSNALNKHKLVIKNNLNDFFSPDYKDLAKITSKKFKIDKKYIGITRLFKINEYYEAIDLIKALGLRPIAYSFKDEMVANKLHNFEKNPYVYIYTTDEMALALYFYNEDLLYSRLFDLSEEGAINEIRNSILAYQNKIYKLTLEKDISKVCVDGSFELFKALSSLNLPFEVLETKCNELEYKKNLNWILPSFEFGFSKKDKKEKEPKTKNKNQKTANKKANKSEKKKSFWTMEISFKKKPKDNSKSKIKKGFTLTEVIVSSVLFALTAAAITSTVLVFNNAFHKNVDSLLLNHTVDEITLKLKNDKEFLNPFINNDKIYYFNPNSVELSDQNLNHKYSLKLSITEEIIENETISNFSVSMTNIKVINNSKISMEDINFNVLY